MRLKDLGEFRFIERIAKKIKVDSSVIKGIGDDTAVIRWSKGRYLLFASDMLIEDVHFNLKKCTPFSVGHKAIAANISDIAAMGGIPRYVSVSLGLPGDLNTKTAQGIYSGLIKTAKKYKINITGGDISSSKKIVIDVAILGEARKRDLILRSNAKLQDVIVVTGRLGGSIKGKHLKFTPRLKQAQFLTRNFKINSMIDLSDGLSSDLDKVCAASRVGAKIYKSLVPLSKDASSIKDALNNGEDFELLFTVPIRDLEKVLKNFKKKFKTPITPVGEVRKKKEGIKIIDSRGRASSLKPKGFSHFK